MKGLLYINLYFTDLLKLLVLLKKIIMSRFFMLAHTEYFKNYKYQIVFYKCATVS